MILILPRIWTYVNNKFTRLSAEFRPVFLTLSIAFFYYEKSIQFYATQSSRWSFKADICLQSLSKCTLLCSLFMPRRAYIPFFCGNMDIIGLFKLVGIRPTTESSMYAVVYLFNLFLSSANSNIHIGACVRARIKARS